MDSIFLTKTEGQVLKQEIIGQIPQMPKNQATIDLEGQTGNTYAKSQLDEKLKDAKSGIKGTATQSNAPTPYDAVTYPDGLFETYVVRTPITSPNSWGNFTVTQNELDNNIVYFDVNNGVITKATQPIKGAYQSYLNTTTDSPPMTEAEWSVSFIAKISDNLLKNVKLFDGKYINHNDGYLIEASTHTTTDFIEITKNIHYSLKYFDNTFFAFYDDAKVFVSDTRSANRIFDFKKPTNAKYIRVSYLTTNVSEMYLLKVNDVFSENWGVNLMTNVKINTGLFVSQSSGGNAQESNFSVTDFIPLIENRFYGINKDNYQQFAFYDDNLQFLSNSLSADNKKVFKVPTNAKFARFSMANSEISTFYLKLLNPKFEEKVIEIGKVVTDFPTIQNSIDYANSTNESHTIKISNGVYLEELFSTSFNVAHSFIGQSKKETVISDVNDTDQKWEILRVSGGYFENLYFRRKGGGYAVHSDFPKQGVIEFFNCRIESSYGSSIGAGSHENQTLKIRNCEIIEKDSFANTGVMYWHNSVSASVSGQRLEMWNNEIYGFDKSLRLDDANQLSGDGLMPFGNATVLFVGNNFYSKDHAKELDFRQSQLKSGALVGNIKLDERSFGNNISELNF